MYVKIQYKDTSDMNFYVWTKKKAPNLYQLGANDNEKETLIDCTSASAVFFYQIKSFVSILEDESARFFCGQFYHDAGQPHSGYGPRGQLCGLSARRNPAHHQTGRCRSAAGRHDWGCCLLCRFRCAIEQIAVSANENLSVNNDISVSLSITFYEKQIEK